MTPETARLPVAAGAPAWLEARRRDEHLALVAQYGPRRAFLPLARAEEEGAAPEIQIQQSAVIDPFAFFAAPGAGEAQDWSN